MNPPASTPSTSSPDPVEPVAGARNVPNAPDDDTVVGLLEALRADGFTADLRPRDESGSVVCGACDATTPADPLIDLDERRLEGASDPDDMVLVVAARCPSCETGGVMVLGFGPNASAEDAGVVALLA